MMQVFLSDIGLLLERDLRVQAPPHNVDLLKAGLEPYELSFYFLPYLYQPSPVFLPSLPAITIFFRVSGVTCLSS